jgi:hypothetical protein
MLGWPSVWPFFSIAQYSMVASLLAAAGVAVALWRIARRQVVPDHLLLFVLAVWIPLLMIGCMRWMIPPRYAEAQVMPLLLCGFASAQWLCGLLAQTVAPESAALPAHTGALTAALAGILVVSPARLAATVDSGYANHPDHKGAADYIRSLHLGPHDVLVAEDVLQQTYYLGHVDYWLLNRHVAASYVRDVNGERRDFYTNTPLLGTGQELERLLDDPHRGALYVIGSGEDQSDGRALMRGMGISQVLKSPRFHIVYHGRDGLTDVWRVDPPLRSARAAGQQP